MEPQYHKHNLDGRQLRVGLIIAAPTHGMRAAIISITEDGRELGRLKLEAPLGPPTSIWVRCDDPMFLEQCWEYAQTHNLLQATINSPQQPLIRYLR